MIRSIAGGGSLDNRSSGGNPIAMRSASAPDGWIALTAFELRKKAQGNARVRGGALRVIPR